MLENPRGGRQARNFTTNVSKILDLKSFSEQIFFRKLSLGAPDPRTFFSVHAILRPSIINERLVWHSSKRRKSRNERPKILNQSMRGDQREPNCIKLYVCSFQPNWNPDRWNYSLQSKRICSIVTRDDETERGLWRAKDERRASFQARGRRG